MAPVKEKTIPAALGLLQPARACYGGVLLVAPGTASEVSQQPPRHAYLEGGVMGTNSDRPYVEPITMNEVEIYLYEAIAELEYIGRLVTKTEIAAVAYLDDATIEQTLHDMTERGLLVQSDCGSEPAYQPARRDWSLLSPDDAPLFLRPAAHGQDPHAWGRDGRE
jgi:hypothetical protein